jgi:hypothetical protein
MWAVVDERGEVERKLIQFVGQILSFSMDLL